MVQAAVSDGPRLINAREMLPDGIDLTNEDEFIQAGAMLVDHINGCMLAIGELLEWKLYHEGARDDLSRDRIFARYAHAWGTSRVTLIRAWILATKHPDVARPADVSSTAAYEVLSGSETEEEAEAGMQAVAEQGLSAEKVREAKMLQRAGLNEPRDWTVPYLFYKDGDIWARDSTGDEIMVWKAKNKKDNLARRAQVVSRRRLHV